MITCCPHCKSKFNVRKELTEQRRKCPKCGQPFVVRILSFGTKISSIDTSIGHKLTKDSSKAKATSADREENDVLQSKNNYRKTWHSGTTESRNLLERLFYPLWNKGILGKIACVIIIIHVVPLFILPTLLIFGMSYRSLGNNLIGNLLIIGQIVFYIYLVLRLWYGSVIYVCVDLMTIAILGTFVFLQVSIIREDTGLMMVFMKAGPIILLQTYVGFFWYAFQKKDFVAITKVWKSITRS